MVPTLTVGPSVCAALTSRSQWGQNSGHVGVPLENIPAFIQKLQFLYQKTTGQTLKASARRPITLTCGMGS